MLSSPMADFGKLPNEVVVEILSRVAPESLARFKCISKSWHALINDPNFCGCLKNQNVLVKRLVVNKKTEQKETRFFFLKYPLNDESFEFSDDKFLDYLKICGHSHGLVSLYSHDRNHIFVYNPTTGELRKLPPTIHFNYINSIELGIRLRLNAVGFGYDPKSKDFKVVTVMDVDLSSDDLMYWRRDSKRSHYLKFYNTSRVEVYDLKKDKWREIETHVPGHVLLDCSFHMYYQGFYYWSSVSKDEGKPEIILSFDLSEEVFSQIPLPGRFKGRGNDEDRRLGIFNGSIVLFNYRCPRVKRSFDIWKMDKVGEVIAWSKLFKIRLSPKLSYGMSPLGFVGLDQLLMKTNERELILLNINNQHFQRIPLKDYVYESMVGFVKTLLPLNAMEDNNNIGGMHI